MIDWNVIKAEYIAGGTSYRALAEKYGVSESTLKKKAAKEQWTELRSQIGTETEQKIVDLVADKKSKGAVSAVSLINESAMNMLRQIAKETVKGVTETKFSIYARALKQLKEALGVQSSLDQEEQKARIDNLRKQAEREHTDENINIVLGQDGEDYSV